MVAGVAKRLHERGFYVLCVIEEASMQLLTFQRVWMEVSELRNFPDSEQTVPGPQVVIEEPERPFLGQGHEP